MRRAALYGASCRAPGPGRGRPTSRRQTCMSSPRPRISYWSPSDQGSCGMEVPARERCQTNDLRPLSGQPGHADEFVASVPRRANRCAAACAVAGTGRSPGHTSARPTGSTASRSIRRNSGFVSLRAVQRANYPVKSAHAGHRRQSSRSCVTCLHDRCTRSAGTDSRSGEVLRRVPPGGRGGGV